jgi:hypothetical protein
MAASSEYPAARKIVVSLNNTSGSKKQKTTDEEPVQQLVRPAPDRAFRRSGAKNANRPLSWAGAGEFAGRQSKLRTAKFVADVERLHWDDGAGQRQTPSLPCDLTKGGPRRRFSALISDPSHRRFKQRPKLGQRPRVQDVALLQPSASRLPDAELKIVEILDPMRIRVDANHDALRLRHAAVNV